MTDRPNGPWFDCLPSCATHLQCGQGWHTIRWEAGELRLLSHPDVEAELVLAALGGEKARCVEVAQAWERHAEDLSVLAIGPRGPADEIAVSWDEVDAASRAPQFGGWSAYAPGTGALYHHPGPGSRRGPAPMAPPVPARYQQAMRDREQAARRRNDCCPCSRWATDSRSG